MMHVMSGCREACGQMTVNNELHDVDELMVTNDAGCDVRRVYDVRCEVV